jgi:NADH-quinone oxidoreductase subunit M
MVNHGLVVAGVFMVIAILYDRTRTEDVTKMGGQAMRAPFLAALFLVIAMANLAIPGSSNFIGEFYILNGVFQSKIVFAFIAAIGIALAAFYSLRLYQRTMHNRLPEGAESREIGPRDAFILAPLVAVIVALALWPGLILERGEKSVTAVVAAANCKPGTTHDENGYVLTFCGLPTETADLGRGWTGYAPVANHDRVQDLPVAVCARLAKAVGRWHSASLADDYVGGCQ